MSQGRRAPRVRSGCLTCGPSGERKSVHGSVSGDAMVLGQQAGAVEVTQQSVEPNVVVPDGRMRLNLKLANNAGFISPTDPALCNPSGLSNEGLQVEVTANPAWTGPKTKRACVSNPLFGVGGVFDMDFEFVAPPSGGQTTIAVTMQQVNKEDTVTSFSVPVSVSETGSQEPPDDGDGDGSGSPGNLIGDANVNQILLGGLAVSAGILLVGQLLGS